MKLLFKAFFLKASVLKPRERENNRNLKVHFITTLLLLQWALHQTNCTAYKPLFCWCRDFKNNILFRGLPRMFLFFLFLSSSSPDQGCLSVKPQPHTCILFTRQTNCFIFASAPTNKLFAHIHFRITFPFLLLHRNRYFSLVFLFIFQPKSVLLNSQKYNNFFNMHVFWRPHTQGVPTQQFPSFRPLPKMGFTSGLHRQTEREMPPETFSASHKLPQYSCPGPHFGQLETGQLCVIKREKRSITTGKRLNQPY